MAAREYRHAALSNLSGNWGIGVLITFSFLMIMGFLGYPMYLVSVLADAPAFSMVVFSPIPPFGLFLAGMGIIVPVLSWSFILAFLLPVRGRELKLKALTYGFHNFKRVWCLQMLIFVYEFLWSLLLIVPGIVKAYSYAMAPYILADNPGMGANEAITRSRKMMDGHKWRLFCLEISFIGWALLNALTLGFGTLWLAPYQATAFAHFYDELSRAASTDEAVSEGPSDAGASDSEEG